MTTSPASQASSDAVLTANPAIAKLSIHLGKKAALYAAAGIADYWVANLETKSLVVHRAPKGGQYASIVTRHGNEEARTLVKPHASLVVAALYCWS